MHNRVLLTATVQSHICQFHKPLVQVLHQLGYEVHVAARDNLAEKNGLRLDFVEQVFDVPFARSPGNSDNLRAYQQLRRIIDHGNYSFIHCNTPMGGIVTRLAARAARRAGTRLIYTAHGFHFYQGAPRLNWFVYYPIERLFAHLTDILVTITHEDYELATHHFSCQVTHIHGVGVDEHRYTPADESTRSAVRSKLGFSPGQPILLCIGELLPNKNQRMAIRMMQHVVAHHPDALLLIAGNGPERIHLEQYIAERSLQDNVRLLGYVTNLQEIQHAVDLQVCCSYREGLPLNVVESMLSGNPVVATANRGHRELIHDAENGFLVSPDDDRAMAQCVLRLLHEPTLRLQMRQRALDVASQYTYTAVSHELKAIYDINK